jgi:hypothetical protein
LGITVALAADTTAYTAQRPFHFPRNEYANPAEYRSEWPDVIPHDERSKNAKTTKGKIKDEETKY